MNISKDTKINTSLATIATVFLWMGGMQWKAFEIISDVKANTTAVATFPEYITKTVALELLIAANAASIELMAVKDVQDTIRDLRRDKRKLDAERRRDATNEYIVDDIAAVEDDIIFYEELLECLREGRSECE